MPTYRNDSENTYKVLNSEHNEQVVQPRESVATLQFLDISGMTKTAEAPYFNPSDGVHEVTSTGPADDKTIVLDSATNEIEIWNESEATITCFLRTTANTPGLKILAKSIRNISGLSKRVDQIILQFSTAVSSGQCYLTELED